MPEVGEVKRLGWDVVPILESVIEMVKVADFDYMLTPTESRGRSIRNLVVNLFHPFQMLPESWETGSFDWNPELTDEDNEQPLTDREKMVGYGEAILFGWQMFLLDKDEELDGEGPEIDTPRGRVTFNVALAGQRYHAAWHHRQILDHLRKASHELPDALDVEVLSEDLVLPARIY